MKELENLMSDSYIFITDKGVAINGSTSDILSFYTMLTSEMLKLKGVNKDIIKQSFDMAFMNDDELYDLFKKKLNTFADNLKKFIEDEKSNK